MTTCSTREEPQRRGQLERQKVNFMIETCTTLFGTLHDLDGKFPNATFYGGMLLKRGTRNEEREARNQKRARGNGIMKNGNNTY